MFRGTYTKNATFGALLKLLTLRDPIIETLMVIGYNPSHSNINSEVNAPFKILSLMLRFLDNENNSKKKKGNFEEDKSEMTPGYSMRRDMIGERLDTQEGDDEDSDEEESKGGNGGTEKIEVNLDDVEDDDDRESLLGLSGGDKAVGSLFKVQESKDGGLADMETGSEVYMSELLVSAFPLMFIGWI